MERRHPTKNGAIRALLAAPLLPVGLLFAFDASSRALQDGPLAIIGAAMLAVYMLIVVEVFAVVLGGVFLAALWHRIPLNILVCVVMGGLVAVLPFLVIALISATQEPINYDAWHDGHRTVVRGVKTAYGRWFDFLALLQIFGLGMIGGAFFWWLCRRKTHGDAQVP